MLRLGRQFRGGWVVPYFGQHGSGFFKGFAGNKFHRLPIVKARHDLQPNVAACLRHHPDDSAHSSRVAESHDLLQMRNTSDVHRFKRSEIYQQPKTTRHLRERVGDFLCASLDVDRGDATMVTDYYESFGGVALDNMRDGAELTNFAHLRHDLARRGVCPLS